MNGCDATHYKEKEKAAIHGREKRFVFQDFHLIQELTARENVKRDCRFNCVLSKIGM